jgi:hypothetical protein
MWGWLERRWIAFRWATYDLDWQNKLSIRLLGCFLLLGAGLFFLGFLETRERAVDLACAGILCGAGGYCLVRGRLPFGPGLPSRTPAPLEGWTLLAGGVALSLLGFFILQLVLPPGPGTHSQVAAGELENGDDSTREREEPPLKEDEADRRERDEALHREPERKRPAEGTQVARVEPVGRDQGKPPEPAEKHLVVLPATSPPTPEEKRRESERIRLEAMVRQYEEEQRKQGDRLPLDRTAAEPKRFTVSPFAQQQATAWRQRQEQQRQIQEQQRKLVDAAMSVKEKCPLSFGPLPVGGKCLAWDLDAQQPLQGAQHNAGELLDSRQSVTVLLVGNRTRKNVGMYSSTLRAAYAVTADVWVIEMPGHRPIGRYQVTAYPPTSVSYIPGTLGGAGVEGSLGEAISRRLQLSP